MITFLKALPLFCLIGIAPTIVHAGDEDLFCRNGDFPAQSGAFGEARVVGNDRLHFLSDMDGCPGKGATCAERAYVLPGDRLIVGRIAGHVDIVQFGQVVDLAVFTFEFCVQRRDQFPLLI